MRFISSYFISSSKEELTCVVSFDGLFAGLGFKEDSNVF
jgi:hypothetical protein